MTTLIQILFTITLIQYLGSTIVLGRPRLGLEEKLSNKNDVNRRLSDYFFELITRRHKRHVQMLSRDGTKAILGKAVEYRHLQRIKRDLFSNPCYKHDSFKTFTLNNNSLTFSVECLQSSTTGCFQNVLTKTTTLCKESRTYFPSADQVFVQGCSCA